MPKKLLTVSIAAYNVAPFIRRALDSLEPKKHPELEILVEDDGGTDKTAEIVKTYEKKYPDVVKLIHKKNAGYGSTVNKSLILARGKYFKLLDGDDWFNSKNFNEFLKILKTTNADAVVSPVFHYFESGAPSVLHGAFKRSLSGLHDFDAVADQFEPVGMHCLAFKTSILREIGLKLPEHSLYTDTFYAFLPILDLKTIYFFNKPIYTYFIGRDEQSTSEKSRVKHYREFLKISKKIISKEIPATTSAPVSSYLAAYATIQHALPALVAWVSFLPLKQSKSTFISFEHYIKKHNPVVFEEMSNRSRTLRLLRSLNYRFFFVFRLVFRHKNRKGK